MLDQGLGSKECIVLARKLLNQLFVLVELLQVVRRHGVNTMMLSSVDIVLVAENAEGHPRAGNLRKADGTRAVGSLTEGSKYG